MACVCFLNNDSHTKDLLTKQTKHKGDKKVQKIEFKNADNKVIEFSRTFPYLLQNLTGIGAPPVTTLPQRGFQQDGVSFFGTLLEPRTIDFDLFIKGSSRADLMDKRAEIMEVFNPKLGLGTLTYSNDVGSWQIPAAVYDGPIDSENMMNSLIQSFQVGLFCPNPAWQSVEENASIMGGDINGLTLGEMTLPFILATIGEDIEVDYEGTLDAPLLIEFSGVSSMPKLTKQETGETIEVEVDLLEGQSLYIDTDPNDINIYMLVDGVKTPALNYIKADSEYFLMTKGKNTFKFSSASGEPEVKIMWRDRYIGV